MKLWFDDTKIQEIAAENDILVRENILLKKELEFLRARVEVLEADEREIRVNLLRRSGILPSAEKVDQAERSLKPVKKVTLPWSQQAAKLEADSKERYWKKQIEVRERPQEERKQAQSTQEQEDFDKDMEELNNVSS